VVLVWALQRSGSAKVGAFPSLDVVPLMVTMVEHVDMSRDYVVTKSIWHLSDAALKSVCESPARHCHCHRRVVSAAHERACVLRPLI
jgi:hypothetical protein